ncbi:M48 family metalloprotease [Phormidium sp. LEGE 05292]|uniref:M48 family metallopeptidase n=1 Tax=[Phormidium] sp. LEGE 05292 TaxID=767427 RepID=UPI00187EBC91|nr:M48 family metalloprotease [Phormidium sp. LEGE 05292]MBE9225765.1 M48 family metalloprotease [Phormidium sp. LEGE 05292]
MASVPESPLEAGLTALKQKDYLSAIAHLESVCQNELNETILIKAQMGLVAAYEAVNDVEKAINLTQQLSESTNSKVQEWAVGKLEYFNKNYPEQTKPKTAYIPPNTDSGFVPLDKLPPPSTQRVSVNLPNPTPKSNPNNLAGFTPIEPSKKLESPPTIESAFQPNKQQKIPENPAVKRSISDNQSVSNNQQEQVNIPVYKPEWKQAERAKKWQKLPVNLGFRFDITQLWGVQVISAIAITIPLYWVISNTASFLIGKIHEICLKLSLYPYNENDPYGPLRYVTPIAVIVIIGLIVATPWLIDILLKLISRLEPLPLTSVSETSPEASRLMQRICREKKLAIPQLFVLPDKTPLICTYGNSRINARIVVSQGLLEQLTDDEIAVVYATQLGHILCWDFALMSWGVLVTLLPYVVYYQFSQSADDSENALVRFIGGAIAALGYGLYWCFRWPMLWLSRARINFSDRLACEITGNPNGLTRALLKTCIGIAENIQKQRETSYLLESFSPLNIVGTQQAITLGSLYALTPLEPILTWDYLNPYRRWLTINNSHLLLGERLRILARYAQYWKLETELNLIAEPAPKTKFAKLLLQGLPYLGIFLGLALGGTLWLIGGISTRIKLKQVLLDWMWGDWSLIYGCLLIGISLGILFRLNAFFPDRKIPSQQKSPSLPQLLTNPATLPIDTQQITWEGKLLGHYGVSNWLCQDLILQTATGLIKLHHFSWFGPLGNLFSQSPRPSEMVNRNVTITGWFHRGATPWLDVRTLSTQTGATIHSSHPTWSFILALAAALWGAYIIYQGS